MHRHKVIGLPAFIIISVIGIVAHVDTTEAALIRSFAFGGRVSATPETLQATIACAAAYGPFLGIPYNPAIPGPYFIRATTRGTPAMNKHILALYNTVPDVGTCYNPETGVPVPAFEIKLYGVSR